MKKYQLNLTVAENLSVGNGFILLSLTSDTPLPKIYAGQFAELLVDNSKVLLRRPISIHNVDTSNNVVEFLIQIVGEGTKALSKLCFGDTINLLLPLGNGFSYQNHRVKHPLLIGGGVGVAPLYYLGKELIENSVNPTFLFGGRSINHLHRLEQFQRLGKVYATTEDGSYGEKGVVTSHTLLLDSDQFDMVYCCGPTPMMKAVAKWADMHDIECEVSLEHRMACGIGACLCCVEMTPKGHLCVCKDGPVFSTKDLLWNH